VANEGTLTISIEPNASPEIHVRIDSLLHEEAEKALGQPLQMREFCAVLRNSNGESEGGITARSYWEWLRVDSLAVAPRWRGLGYGRSLLGYAEQWGLECSCHDAWLMTMSAEARTFYERSGYRVFAELPNFGTLTRFFMRKPLV
jgi:GNAT superfamily N-acetyltransferase